jgi:hypothetical protein
MKQSKIADLKPDPKNARKHPARNMAVLERSLEKHGAARSIVVDEDGRILAGNGIVEAAKAVGIKNIIRVETDGKSLVAVVRRGLTEKQKLELAVADNRASDLSEFDPANLKAASEQVDLSDYFSEQELEDVFKKLEPIPEERYPEMELQPFEHYDYIVLFFRNSMDFLQACERFGLKKVGVDVGGKRGQKVGLGRCLDGAKALGVLCPSK